MNEFNIEDLERKNIYKAPEGAFERIQSNVFSSLPAASQVPEPKRFSLKSYTRYVAAAALALVFGLGLYTLKTKEQFDQEKIDREFKLSVDGENLKQTAEPFAVEENTAKTPGEVLTSEPSANPTHTPVLTAAHTTSEKAAPRQTRAKTTKPLKTEAAVEQVLTSFSSAELAELSSDAELDVYLDLY